jgi:hypothetical protein
MSIDHSWVGLVTCDGVSTNWFACGDNSPTVTHGMGCNCPQTSATLAFTAADSPIQEIMQLGLAYPQSSCFPSFTAYCSEATQGSSPSSTTPTAAPSSTSPSTPTASRTTSTSLTTNSGGSVITVITTQIITASANTSIFTPPPATYSTAGFVGPVGPSTSPDTGLQTPARIGIGIGSAVGAVSIGALLWFCISCMRKRSKKKSALRTEDRTGPVLSEDANAFVEKDNLGSDDPRSPTWSGHKSELPANKDSRSPTWSGHKSELPADDHEVKSPVPTYEPFRGSYRSSTTAEVEGSPRFGGQGREVREGVYEMP